VNIALHHIYVSEISICKISSRNVVFAYGINVVMLFINVITFQENCSNFLEKLDILSTRHVHRMFACAQNGFNNFSNLSKLSKDNSECEVVDI